MLDDLICEHCKGSGIRAYYYDEAIHQNEIIDCEFCDGKGRVRNPDSYFWRRENK
jgi:hypothetical protein